MDVKQEIRKIFNQQGLMKTLGAQIVSIKKGNVILSCKWQDSLTQQHGYLHAGVVTSLADSACGFAARTMMPTESEVLSVEFKMNFLKPVTEKEIVAKGIVLQTGKTLVVCEGTVTDNTGERILAKMLATMICKQRK